MKNLEVTILGQSYLLACPPGGEALLQAAVHTVDQEMSAIRDAGKVKARERMAVLAALNLAYQLAERPAAAVRDAAPPASTAAATGDGGELSAADAELVEQLIARLDTSLGDDGRLF